MKQWKLIATAALTPAICLADPPPAEPPPPWSGDASAGYLRTTGNTNSTSLNFKGDLDWNYGRWQNHFDALGTYGSSKGASTAESYQFGDKLNYDLSPEAYVFGNLEYADDRFAGVVSRYSESVGYGRHLIKSPMQTLDIDAGAGASQSRNAGETDYDDQLIGVFNVAYLLNAQYKQTLHIEAGKENTFINPVAELKLAIIGNFFATLGYDWRHNTSVPAGSVHTDTITTVNFGYTFGKKPA
jgi:putative salt-induced outer membrane protein